MNSEQAKKLSLPDILSKLGYAPTKTTKAGNELWYSSPFRNDTTPSFHTSFLGGKWIWNDFGDQGGTVIDFAMRYKNTDPKGALDFLERLSGSISNSSNQQSLFSATTVGVNTPSATSSPPEVETLSIVKISPLTVDSFNGKALLQYLTEKRGINPVIACKYLVEVQYKNNETGKTYFAAAIQNQQGGYEIRNPYFKSSLGQKGISVIKGKDKGQATVFEGFIDFLSALTYFEAKDLAKFQQIVESDVIIMNSASFQEHTKEFLKSGSYSQISLYMDNDTTGDKVKAALIAECPGQIEDCSTIYAPHKDFNLLLQSLITPVVNHRT